MFRKVIILGVGEIGGSIGRDIKKKRLAKEVVGVGRRISSLRKAKKIKAVDKIYLVSGLKKAVRNADLIILATPIFKIAELGIIAGGLAECGAIITDVGSTKKYIVEQLEKKLPRKVKFVGAHPMAGSEKGGPLNSRENLFKDRNCFITRTISTDKKALIKIKKFWKKLGARPIEISSGKHDKIVAGTSHMIHVVVSSLVLANKDTIKYTASGFKDTTRIALADPNLWKDICLTNNKEIAKSLSNLIKILTEFKNAILHTKASKIISLLSKAKNIRSQLENL